MKRESAFLNRFLGRMLLLCSLWALLPLPAQAQAPGPRVDITGVERNHFPELELSIILSDARSQPLEDLSDLRLRENGVPIADFTVGEVPVGIDLTVVIDARPVITETAESGGSQLQAVRDSLLRFSGRYMEPGRDRVSILVPEAEGPEWLIRDTSEPAALLNALAGYRPQPPAEAQTVALLETALAATAAADRGSGPHPFQGILLFSDGSRLNRYLFPPLVEEARGQQVPVFVLLQGEEPPSSAPETLAALYEPTRGFLARLEEPGGDEGVYSILQAHSTQRTIDYESNLRQDGTYPITVALPQAEDELLFELELGPPQVTLTVPDTTVRRVGTAVDTPVPQLQPVVQPLTVTVGWSDETPRALVAASLLVDGVTRPTPFVGSDGLLQFEWDIAELEAGEYSLTAQVTDTLGFSGVSLPVLVSIDVVRPQPQVAPSPTPTPLPPTLRERLSRRTLAPPLSDGLLLLGASGATITVVGLFLALRWRGRRQDEDASIIGEGSERLDWESPPGEEEVQADAYLEVLLPGAPPTILPIKGRSLTLGRDESAVDVVLADESVARFHARISRREGNYWLYDEGSSEGTYLNFQRLGLAPQPLQDGDRISIGRVRLRFQRVAPE